MDSAPKSRTTAFSFCRLATSKKGFTLIEAILVLVVIGISFFGFGYLFGNLVQDALRSDLTVMATKLAREKMEMVLQEKADSGFAAVVSEAASPVSSGTWTFQRSVDVTTVNASNLTTTPPLDSNFKRVIVTVSWGAGNSNQVALTTLVTNVVP